MLEREILPDEDVHVAVVYLCHAENVLERGMLVNRVGVYRLDAAVGQVAAPR